MSDARARGAELFKAGKYEEAKREYSRGIDAMTDEAWGEPAEDQPAAAPTEADDGEDAGFQAFMKHKQGSFAGAMGLQFRCGGDEAKLREAAILYTNRAMCSLRLDDLMAAEADAVSAFKLCDSHHKAHWVAIESRRRRGEHHAALDTSARAFRQSAREPQPVFQTQWLGVMRETLKGLGTTARALSAHPLGSSAGAALCGGDADLYARLQKELAVLERMVFRAQPGWSEYFEAGAFLLMFIGGQGLWDDPQTFPRSDAQVRFDAHARQVVGALGERVQAEWLMWVSKKTWDIARGVEVALRDGSLDSVAAVVAADERLNEAQMAALMGQGGGQCAWQLHCAPREQQLVLVPNAGLVCTACLRNAVRDGTVVARTQPPQAAP